MIIGLAIDGGYLVGFVWMFLRLFGALSRDAGYDRSSVTLGSHAWLALVGAVLWPAIVVLVGLGRLAYRVTS